MASGPGPQFTFPQSMSAISFKSGRFLVVEIYYNGKNRTGRHTVVSSSFGETSTEKTMPFIQNGARGKKPDSLNLKTDLLLTSQAWTQHTGPDTDAENTADAFDEYRVILFVNVGLAEKSQSPAEKYVDLVIDLDGISGTGSSGGDTKGYWAWNGTSTEFGVPPPPTPEDALSVIHIDTLIGPYNGVWIEYFNGDVFKTQIIPGWRQRNAERGLPIPSLQQGPYGGWADAAQQIASIDAINQGIVADHAIANTPVDPAELLFPVTYDFGNTPDNGKTPQIDYEIKAGYYAGRLNYPYDTEKKKLFPDASEDTEAQDKAQRMATFTKTKTKPSDKSTIRIVLDKDNHVTIREE